MRSLEEIFEEIKEKRVLSNKKPDGDAGSYNVRLGKMKRAKIELKTLENEYRDAVRQKAIFMVVTGTQIERFAKEAEEDYNCFTVGTDDLFRDITEDLSDRYYKNTASSSALFDILMSNFNLVCNDLDIVSYPMVTFKQKFAKTLKDRNDVIALAKEAFTEKMGYELLGLYAISKIAKAALEKEYTQKTVPVVIKTNKDDQLDAIVKDLGIGTPFVFAIKTNKKTVVEKELISIKEQLS